MPLAIGLEGGGGDYNVTRTLAKSFASCPEALILRPCCSPAAILPHLMQLAGLRAAVRLSSNQCNTSLDKDESRDGAGSTWREG